MTPTDRDQQDREAFEHYTADKPLLGRAAGVYWWENHARGSKKLGEVIKDYQVGEAS